MPSRTLLRKPAAKKPAPAAAVRDDLVAPPVFARILPKNVGGHRDDGKAVAKRLKSWSEEKDDARVTLSDGHGETHYTFPTRVFGPDASREDLFNEVAGPLLQKFLHPSDPQSAFLFAYGQTGTGKTYTMSGPESTRESSGESRQSTSAMENNPFVQTQKAFGGVAGEDRGVVARALERILRVCAADGAHNSQVSGEPRTYTRALRLILRVASRRITRQNVTNVSF